MPRKKRRDLTKAYCRTVPMGLKRAERGRGETMAKLLESWEPGE